MVKFSGVCPIECLPKQFWTRHIFGFLCLIGLIVHVVQISSEYFGYKSTTTVRLDIPKDVAIPSLSVCWRYADLLDTEALRKINVTLPAIDFTNDETVAFTIRTIQSSLTVEQIFGYTPDSSTIFNQCLVRKPDEYDVRFLKPTDCRTMFNITKFYLQEYICYRSKLHANGTYNYQTTGSALAFPGMAFEISFRLDLFGKNQIVVPVIEAPDKYPQTSMYFGPEMRRFDTIDQSTPNNYFYLSYLFIDNKRLPAPYETKCVDYGIDRNQYDCNKACVVMATLQKWNRLPFTELIRENESFPIDKQLIHNWDFNSSSFKQDLSIIESTCGDKCKNIDCETRVFMTQAKYIGKRTENIAFRVNLPSNSNFHVLYLPMMLFYEYLTYVLSSLGIWFGVSVFGVIPIAYIVKDKPGNFQTVKNERRLVREENFWLKREIDTIKGQMNYVRHEQALFKVRNNLK